MTELHIVSRLQPGHVLPGGYRLLSKMTAGAQGEVWVAQSPKFDAEVVVKALFGTWTEGGLLRLEQEAQLLRRLTHPNICVVYDFNVEHDPPFLVLQYVEQATDLKSFLDRGEPLSWAVVANLLEQLLRGLGAAHDKKIVHRDIKPSNILVRWRVREVPGSDRMVYSDPIVSIIDFGIAKDLELKHTLVEGASEKPRGTWRYAAPEVYAAAAEITEAADVYSVGVMAYELVIGRPFWRMEAARDLAGTKPPPPLHETPEGQTMGIPEYFSEIVGMALAEAADERYADANQMLGELSKFREPLAGSLPVGYVLAGYRITHDPIEAGGMGVVYKAVSRATGQKVAIKIIRGTLSLTKRPDETTAAHKEREREMLQMLQARFRREVGILRTMTNPGIPRILALDEFVDAVGTHPFCAMEWVEGRRLGELIRDGGRMPIERVLQIGRDAANILEDVHALGVIHRDVSVNNILVDDTTATRLIDFGISKWDQDTTDLTQGTQMGTPGYASAEALRGEPVSPASDQFSLAACLYAALTCVTIGWDKAVEKLDDDASEEERVRMQFQCVAFGAISPIEELRPEIPPGVASAINRALLPDPKKRFPSMQAFAEALTETNPVSVDPALELTAAAGQPTVALRPPLSPDKQIIAKGRGPLVAAAGILLAAVAGVVLLATNGNDRTEPVADTEPATAAVPVEQPVAAAMPAAGAQANAGPPDSGLADAEAVRPATVVVAELDGNEVVGIEIRAGNTFGKTPLEVEDDVERFEVKVEHNGYTATTTTCERSESRCAFDLVKTEKKSAAGKRRRPKQKERVRKPPKFFGAEEP